MLVGRVCSGIDSCEFTAFDIEERIWTHGEAAVGAGVVVVE